MAFGTCAIFSRLLSESQLVLLALRRLARIGRERREIDQAGNAVIGPRGGDKSPAVRVADKDNRAADSPKRAFYRGDVAF
jgi:hypothetical protein